VTRIACLLLLLLAGPLPQANESTLSHGRFEAVRLYVPTRAEQFVMLLAESPRADAIARELRARGALVAVIDTRALLRDLERDDADCVSPDGDLENLSHYIQASQGLATYHAPILIGEGNDASVVYAMLAQAPPATFAAGISLGFCPTFTLHKPLCVDHTLQSTMRRGRTTLLPAKLHSQWIAIGAETGACAVAAHAFLQRVQDAEVVVAAAGALDHAYAHLAKTVPTTMSAVPQAVANLPVIEVPAPQSGDALVILISGDGGWAGIDREVASQLAASGTPVVGVDALRYFWTKRTPDGLARDIERLAATYRTRWQRKRIVLVGYSQGADVLPFAINRLRPALRHGLTAVLIGPGEYAKFEFHLGNWLGVVPGGLPIAPEMQRIAGVKLICLYGADDSDSKCERYASSRVQLVKLPGGHHFNGDYAGLTRAIMRAASLIDSPSPAAKTDASSGRPAS